MGHYKWNILLAAQAFLWLQSNSPALASESGGREQNEPMNLSGNGLITAPTSEPILQEMGRELTRKMCSAGVKVTLKTVTVFKCLIVIEATPTFITNKALNNS